MKNMKTFIAYLLVAVFLLGSIAASANVLPEGSAAQTIENYPAIDDLMSE